MASKNLHAETIRLLESRPKSLTLRQIAEDADLGEEWIKKVLYGETKDPGVNRIQKLYEYLVGIPLPKQRIESRGPRVANRGVE